MTARYPVTPDGRYFVVKQRLWRCTNPNLSEQSRADWTAALMQARRAVRDAVTDADRVAARLRVQDAKVALGERGPVWWTDGAPDVNRHHPKNTVYADWWAELAGPT